ncbi:MAG: hypothetical protein HY831_03635 [Candidatus Aenigmarchaeota archaeon]|nr:hypothetical protein [Candidatus Aenigmarchaeota archaeon]
MKFKILFVLSLILLSTTSFALSIGASPGRLELGTVHRGEEKLVEFVIFSDTGKEISIKPRILSPIEDYFNPDVKGYETVFNAYEASQEPIDSWIEFIENPILLKPGEFDTKTTYSVGVTSTKKVSFLLKVPENADPGYHASRLSFDANVNNEGEGVKAFAITSVDIPIVFRVDGEAVRSGYISGFNIDNNNLNINFFNNGTTTIRVAASIINILKNGNTIASLDGYPVLVRPKTSVSITKQLSLETGKYEVYSKVVWTTGSSEKSANIFLESKEQNNTTSTGTSIPLNINLTTIVISIAIVIGAIGAIVYIIK